MSYEQNTALLGLNLAELTDMPDRIALPAGTHSVLVTDIDARSDAEAQKHFITIKGKYMATLEFADPVAGPEQAPAEGTEVEFAYAMHSDFGQGAFKKVFLPFAASNGWGTIEDLKNGIVNSTLQVTTTRRPQKDDKTKFNHNIEAVTAG